MRSRRRKAAALFLGMSRFVRKERIASRVEKQIAREKFCVNALASIAREKLSKNARMFWLSSSFVLKEGIGRESESNRAWKFFVKALAPNFVHDVKQETTNVPDNVSLRSEFANRFANRNRFSR
jgi:hypothetical protein